MTIKRRKPVEQLRVPLNCFIAPATKEAITGLQNKTRESQGEVVDRAVALLTEGEILPLPKAKKANKREKAIQERAASDRTAQSVERKDIDYSDVESTPITHVSTLDATSPTGGVGKISLEHWRATRKPLLKPKDKE